MRILLTSRIPFINGYIQFVYTDCPYPVSKSFILSSVNMIFSTFSIKILLTRSRFASGISNGTCIIFSSYSSPLQFCSSCKALVTTSLSKDNKYIILGNPATVLINWKIALICELFNLSMSSITTINLWF